MTENKLNMKNYYSYANTCFGHINYSESIFNPRHFDKIYIIKGVFAQDFITKIAEKYLCECFLNPINPDKADGIIINKIAVINSSLVNFDDSHFPAVIINLNEFCDETMLTQYKEEIFIISEKKQEIYNSGQKFLKAANELAEYLLALSKKYLNEQKLMAAIDRILGKHDINNNQQDYRFINSTGSGELDTLENAADKIFYVSNENFTGYNFMRYILEKSKSSKIICPDALNTERFRAVYLKKDKVLFVLKNNTEKIYTEKYNYINMERFVSPDLKKEHKQKLKFIKKMYDSLVCEAADCFNKIKDLDSKLEKIYAPSVDYNAQQKFISDFIKNL